MSWIQVLDAVKTLDADIFIPGHGPIPDDPKQTQAALDRARQISWMHGTESSVRLRVARLKIRPSRRSPLGNPKEAAVVRRLESRPTANLGN